MVSIDVQVVFLHRWSLRQDSLYSNLRKRYINHRSIHNLVGFRGSIIGNAMEYSGPSDSGLPQIRTQYNKPLYKGQTRGPKIIPSTVELNML